MHWHHSSKMILLRHELAVLKFYLEVYLMTMKSEASKTTDKKDMKGFVQQRKCGFITCIHCINERCSTSKCDMFEREYIQEG